MRLLRKIAFPIALLYGVVIYLRNALYDRGWLKSEAFSTPLISIGNLSLGGTGKTPMIEWLVEHLREQYDLAVLSRGYGRSTSGFHEALADSTAQEIGDEPRQLLNKFPGLTLVVDTNRARAIRWLEANKNPDVIILDDAHQHRRVVPSQAVLLTPYDKPFTRDWFLPTGNLRDSRSQAQRASCIVVTKCPHHLDEAEREQLTKELRAHADQSVFFTTLDYDPMLQGHTPHALTDLKSFPFTLVTGIADPKPLVAYLNKEGYHFEHLRYPDHHDFSASEIKKLKAIEHLIMTEKDQARLGNTLPHAMCIRMRHRFLGADGKAFLEKLGFKIPSASV